MEKEPIQPIKDNLWWVIKGKLAGVRKPVTEEFAELEEMGIGAIVSVLDDPSNTLLYHGSNFAHLWLPIKGGTAPTREHVLQLQGFVDSQNRLGRAVAVHCTNGLRRTGAILAAYLILTGSTYHQAMHIIQTANPNVELREAQTAFLQELAGQ
ncbi:protein phosphatase [Calothrix sp. HK-06]|nr:protein phosphatase [Calothrix sp. HK-06]